MKTIIAALALSFAVAAFAAPTQSHQTTGAKPACCPMGACCATKKPDFWRSRIGHDAPAKLAKMGGCCK